MVLFTNNLFVSSSNCFFAEQIVKAHLIVIRLLSSDSFTTPNMNLEICHLIVDRIQFLAKCLEFGHS